jgi:hypothetical protein
VLRNKPKCGYSGLTIVLSNPSRFDKLRLLTANGGSLFNDYCLRPELNSMMCDVRLLGETEPLLPNTKCLLLLGEAAMLQFLPRETISNTLNEMRGSLFNYKGIPTICSYLPQDAADNFKNYEASLNPLSNDYSPDDTLSDSEEEEGDVKVFGRTKRSNFAFWLKRDVWKCKQILAGYSPSSLAAENSGRYTKTEPPIYRIYPPAEEVINVLRTHKNEHFYFDMETDYEEQNLQCFAFCFEGGPIYSVPVLDFNYHHAYTAIHYILRALAVAIRDNTIVAHNGATFDFLVLAHKYHIPVDKCYDTMIAMHRCFPDIEKSLGHCVSYWTWEKFHKDEDSQGYRTQEQMMDRLKYCGKDVYTMYLIKQEMDKYIKTIPGLQHSVDSAMNCIRPYLTSTLQGIKTDEKKVQNKIQENDRLMVQYNRMIELLIGPIGLADIRGGKKKLSMFAGSNKQCVIYFHDLLGYPVVARGKPDKKTGQRNPSLGKKALYRLALKHENPIITLICAYRGVSKETSRLRFTPWINTNE